MNLNLWKLLNANIKGLTKANEAAALVADTSEVLTNFGNILDKPEVQALAPWIQQGASLLNVLDTPEAEFVNAVIPFAKIATGLLKLYLDKNPKDPSIAQCVILVCLNAYSSSLAELLQGVKVGEKAPLPLMPTSKPEKILEEFELSDKDAKNLLLCFHQSQLALHLAELMRARLQKQGLSEIEALHLTQRATWKTHRYITEAWANLPDLMRSKLGDTTFDNWQQEQKKYQSIDTYLEEYVSPNTNNLICQQQWKVFNQNFTLPEIYVPLRAQPLNEDGDQIQGEEPVDLESWALELLSNSKAQDQVIFIQADPGRGKSVFCRIFANWIREYLYPIWTPILIRLRDIPALHKSFPMTLKEAIPYYFANDSGWLTDKNTRFLFLLDGFDELQMEGRTRSGLKDFLYQVSYFQKNCFGTEMRHRVIITGRSLALQKVENILPDNLKRVVILPMEEGEHKKWFSLWKNIVGKERAQHFSAFLKNKKCPLHIKGSQKEIGLAQEPLLLYLLAEMHRDGKLDLHSFVRADSAQAKTMIYEETLKWMLTRQRPDSLNENLTALNTKDLERILSEAGLCVIQSGIECATISMIENRLKADDDFFGNSIISAHAQLKENPLQNALATFYFQEGRYNRGSVEFVHKSFSEFLCAKRIKQSVEDWTYPGQRKSPYDISEDDLNWQIYDLLGSAVLTSEVVDYLFVLLYKSDSFEPIKLFNRLTTFYMNWCKHSFIDKNPSENYPQKKRMKLQDQNIDTSTHSIDVHAGLNVLIFLFKLHAHAQPKFDINSPSPASITFHPCGIPDTDTWDEDRLLRVIHYADSSELGLFSKVVGPHLVGANLYRANLHNANLYRANLERSNLSRANLYRTQLSKANLSNATLNSANLYSANLDRANLSRADLSSVNLCSATLYGSNLLSANLSSANLSRSSLHCAVLSKTTLDSANLSGANLSEATFFGADLSGADLSGADLSGADLSGADLSGAILSKIRFNEKTKLVKVKGLKSAQNIPENLQLIE